LRIVAIGGAAGLLVDAGRDHHHAAAGKRIVVAVDDVDLGSQGRAVANVGRDRLGGLARAVDQHDVAGAAARHRGESAGAADIAGADDAEFAHG
jgi:hypothetical protein